MKNGELIRILKKNKCFLVRHGSSHDMWYSPKSEKQFAVPRHKDEIKTKTAHTIMKEAGIELK